MSYYGAACEVSSESGRGNRCPKNYILLVIYTISVLFSVILGLILGAEFSSVFLPAVSALIIAGSILLVFLILATVIAFLKKRRNN